METNIVKSCIGGRGCWLWTQVDVEMEPAS